MTGKIKSETTEYLMEIADDDTNRNLMYEAAQELFSRWRKGIDLNFLIELLHSNDYRDKIRGAYYLRELGEAVHDLKVPVTQLANDSLSQCRHAFVVFIRNSIYYDDEIATALAKCIEDLNLYVRLETIMWAIRTSRSIFNHFSELVPSIVGQRETNFSDPRHSEFWKKAYLNRAMRGVDIARRVRKGEEIQQIRSEVMEEDSYIYDSIQFFIDLRRRTPRV